MQCGCSQERVSFWLGSCSQERASFWLGSCSLVGAVPLEGERAGVEGVGPQGSPAAVSGGTEHVVRDGLAAAAGGAAAARRGKSAAAAALNFMACPPCRPHPTPRFPACLPLSCCCRRAAVHAAGAPRHDHGGALEQEGRPAAVRWGLGVAGGSWVVPLLGGAAAGRHIATFLYASCDVEPPPHPHPHPPPHTHTPTPTPTPPRPQSPHKPFPLLPSPAGAMDGTLVVWDAKAGAQSKQYAHHASSVVDADWRNNTTFASCSQDGSIAICKLSDPKPQRHWQVGRDLQGLLGPCWASCGQGRERVLPAHLCPHLCLSCRARRARTAPTSTACGGSRLASCWPPAATTEPSRSGRRRRSGRCTRSPVRLLRAGGAGRVPTCIQQADDDCWNGACVALRPLPRLHPSLPPTLPARAS